MVEGAYVEEVCAPVGWALSGDFFDGALRSDCCFDDVLSASSDCHGFTYEVSDPRGASA